MKKMIIVLALIAGVVLAQSGINRSLTKIEDTSNATTSSTNYVGFAYAISSASAPSTNDAVWMIIKTTVDANGNELTYEHAYNASPAYDAVWENVWTNRANLTYK